MAEATFVRASFYPIQTAPRAEGLADFRIFATQNARVSSRRGSFEIDIGIRALFFEAKYFQSGISTRLCEGDDSLALRKLSSRSPLTLFLSPNDESTEGVFNEIAIQFIAFISTVYVVIYDCNIDFALQFQFLHGGLTQLQFFMLDQYLHNCTIFLHIKLICERTINMYEYFYYRKSEVLS